MRIMRVEDDPAIGALVDWALRGNGFAIDPLASCGHALEAACPYC
jgi:DNA-binding response OmpR family regulator